jgi:hypothetical protein
MTSAFPGSSEGGLVITQQPEISAHTTKSNCSNELVCDLFIGTALSSCSTFCLGLGLAFQMEQLQCTMTARGCVACRSCCAQGCGLICSSCFKTGACDCYNCCYRCCWSCCSCCHCCGTVAKATICMSYFMFALAIIPGFAACCLLNQYLQKSNYKCKLSGDKTDKEGGDSNLWLTDANLILADAPPLGTPLDEGEIPVAQPVGEIQSRLQQRMLARGSDSVK